MTSLWETINLTKFLFSVLKKIITLSVNKQYKIYYFVPASGADLGNGWEFGDNSGGHFTLMTQRFVLELTMPKKTSYKQLCIPWSLNKLLKKERKYVTLQTMAK